MTHVLAVAIKEYRQIVRDRQSLVVLLVLPAMFLLLYGYALNFDIRHIELIVHDRDHSADSRALISRFTSSTYFDLVATAVGDDEVEAALDEGRARVALVIPEGFGGRLRAGGIPDVQVLLAGENANTASTVQGYVQGLLAEMAPPTGGATAIRVEPRIWFNPELRSALFLVPGLIAYISMITAVISTALSIVREKEQGTMEQVRMAPISTPAFMLGKTIPYLVLSQASAIMVILAAMVLFDLPMRGSWAALSLVLALFLIGALGTGLLISTVAETQQVAFQAGALVAFLPTFILSGFIFPISSMPAFLQVVTSVVPAKYFLVALRGLVLKGATLASLWEPLAALALYAVAVLGLASFRLSRQ